MSLSRFFARAPLRLSPLLNKPLFNQTSLTRLSKFKSFVEHSPKTTALIGGSVGLNTFLTAGGGGGGGFVFDPVLWPIYATVGVNACIYLYLNTPRANATSWATKNFTCSYHGVFNEKRFHTLLTSCFSHTEIVHFAFNNIALYSIGSSLCHALGPVHFSVFYLSSAVLSSIGGLVLTRITTRREDLREAMHVPSLGASGAIFAVFACSTILMPSQQYSIIFLPFFSFTGGGLLTALIAFDLCGLVYHRYRGSPLGHGAHLSGSLLGLAWAFAFLLYIENKRKKKKLKRRSERDN